ncbi:mariner Mos1 transposase [Trichonephila clavipes]|nr:mariner Mos1 transposase [Trichonephila clavipes]
MAFCRKQIVTGDKTGCRHFEPESKRQSKQGKRETSLSPKKSKAMYTSSVTLQNLRRAIKSKRPVMLSIGVVLLHDNAHPHVVNAVNTTLQQFRWESLEYPPYSPDLSSCDFPVFVPLKRAIRGHRFPTEDKV